MKLIIIILTIVFMLNCSAEQIKNEKPIKESKVQVACIAGNCNNGQGTFIFPNGEKYVGQFKDGKFHGQGTSTFSNGEKFYFV